LVESSAKSPVARAFMEVADLFSPQEVTAAAKARRWRQ
jgi:hypothetical protein